MEEEAKQARRSSKELDESIMLALEKVIPEYGFSNLQLSTLIKEAGVDYNFFYRKYEVLENLYEKFIGKYDFWLNEKIDLKKLRELGDRKFLIAIFKNLYNDLEENGVMQKILVWELDNTSEITRKSAILRENINMGLIAYYEEVFKTARIDISAINAIMIGGIYYNVIRRNVSNMCGINLSTQKGKEQISQAIETIINMVFDQLEAKLKLENTVRMMAEDGIDAKKIAKYCDISQAAISKILYPK